MPPDLLNTVVGLVEDGNLSDAVRTADEHADDYPTYGMLLVTIGQTLASRGKWKEGEPFLKDGLNEFQMRADDEMIAWGCTSEALAHVNCGNFEAARHILGWTLTSQVWGLYEQEPLEQALGGILNVINAAINTGRPFANILSLPDDAEFWQSLSPSSASGTRSTFSDAEIRESLIQAASLSESDNFNSVFDSLLSEAVRCAKAGQLKKAQDIFNTLVRFTIAPPNDDCSDRVASLDVGHAWARLTKALLVVNVAYGLEATTRAFTFQFNEGLKRSINCLHDAES